MGKPHGHTRSLSSLSDASEYLSSGWRTRHLLLAVVSLFILAQIFISTTPSLPHHTTQQTNSRIWRTAQSPAIYSDSQQNIFRAADMLKPNGKITSKIGKVTSLYYDNPSHATKSYEDALRIHEEHDDLWGYKHYIQRRGDLGYWSKPAYLQAIITAEMGKPPSERLQWLFWHDADIVVMNTRIPLETFLPPGTSKFENITLIVSNDINGLNNGAFFIRVCEQALYFLDMTLAYRHYRPNAHYRIYDQGAMNNLLGEEPWKSSTVHVPQDWFNAFQGEGQDATIPPEWHYEIGHFTPGGLLVHLAGIVPEARPFVMDEWMERRTVNHSKYAIPLFKTGLIERTKSFWETEFDTERQRIDNYWRQFWTIATVGPGFDRQKERAVDALMRDTTIKSQGEFDEAMKKLVVEEGKKKQDGLRKAYNDMLQGLVEDHTEAV